MPMAKIEVTVMDEQQYQAQTRAYFDELAPRWDDIAHHNPDKLRLIVDLAGIAPDSRLLDIGCGTGVMIAPLLATGPQELTAVDLSPRMIERAAGKFHDPRLTLIAGDIFELAASGFDLAMLYSVYPHFPDKPKLAQKIASLLPAGGRFMLAHSESRAVINGRHQSGAVERLSQELKPAAQEAETWREHFYIDTLIDTRALYLISGLRK